MIDTKKEGLSIVAGPGKLEQPFSSVALNEIAEYEPPEVSKIISNYPGITINNPGQPQWWDWKATLNKDDISLSLSMTIFERESKVFCSLTCEGMCEAKILVDLIYYLKNNGFPSVWFHNQNTEMFTPENFQQHYEKKRIH